MEGGGRNEEVTRDTAGEGTQVSWTFWLSETANHPVQLSSAQLSSDRELRR